MSHFSYAYLIFKFTILFFQKMINHKQTCKKTQPPSPNHASDGTIFFLVWALLQRHTKQEGALDAEEN